MDKLKKMFKHGDSSESSQPHSTSSTSSSSTPSHTTSASSPSTSRASQSQSQSQSSAPVSGSAGAPVDAAQSNSGPPAGVLMTTNYGDITIALYSEQTPRVSYDHIEDLVASSQTNMIKNRHARTLQALLMPESTTASSSTVSSPTS